MKTENLIAVLATDRSREPAPRRMLALALVAAVAAAGLGFALLLEPRADFWAAIETWRFDFKFVVSGTLALSALGALLATMRPTAGGARRLPLLAVAPLMLAAAIAVEAATVPTGQWAARWIGYNWLFCLVLIPTLAMVPLAILLAALARGAPTAPRATGALAGLVAGGIAAVFYAAHCWDDSPFFVATWYTLAIAAVAAVGAALGGRLLRW